MVLEHPIETSLSPVLPVKSVGGCRVRGPDCGCCEVPEARQMTCWSSRLARGCALEPRMFFSPSVNLYGRVSDEQGL